MSNDVSKKCYYCLRKISQTVDNTNILFKLGALEYQAHKSCYNALNDAGYNSKWVAINLQLKSIFDEYDDFREYIELFLDNTPFSFCNLIETIQSGILWTTDNCRIMYCNKLQIGTTHHVNGNWIGVSPALCEHHVFYKEFKKEFRAYFINKYPIFQQTSTFDDLFEDDIPTADPELYQDVNFNILDFLKHNRNSFRPDTNGNELIQME